MADDISKNIVIQVTTQTAQLEQSITNLNTIIANLLAQQKQLTDAGAQNSAAFQNNADKIDIYSKSLQNATTQLNSYLAIQNSTAGVLQKNQSLITALTAAKDKYATSVGNNSKKVAELNAAIKTLSGAAQQQQVQTTQGSAAIDASTKSIGSNTQKSADLKNSLGAVGDALKEQKQDVENSKSSFDAHKVVMEHLKTSFDEVKDVSGEFGRSLQDAAQGFNLMKSGLSVIKDGLNGVGDALKADGFDFLLMILQQIFDAFIHSSKGSEMLRGAISAIGVVVNEVKGFFNSFMNGLINAVSHPVDAVKSLGNIIEQNIINRFKAFGVILDGIIHFDFKKITNGAIQAFTGVTNATDKIGTAFEKIKSGVIDTAGKMVTAYNKAGKQVDAHEKKVKDSADRQIGYYDKIQKKVRQVYKDQDKASARPEELGPASSAGVSQTASADQPAVTIQPYNIADTRKNGDAVVKINKSVLEQLENDTKKNAEKIADESFKVLTDSIKQQADAKVAALENQKNTELSNTNLTSAQKLVIEAKFKKQEDQVKAKAFKEEQELNIAKTLMAAAQAEIKLWADPGFPAAIAQTVVLAAETAAQVAKISAQKPPAYATGGLHYASDGMGGLLPGYSRTDNTNAHLRSGEGIVVSEAMRAPWARNLVSAINVGFGGRDFSISNPGRGYAVGGIFTDGGDANRYYNAPINDQKNLANTIAYQMINNFPPVYVDVKDINNQQNILAQTINRVNL